MNFLITARRRAESFKWMLVGIFVAFSTSSFGQSEGLQNGGFANEQDKGLGETMADLMKELGTGGSLAIQIGAAAVGFGMVAWSVYGLTMGRKKDEREFPMGTTLAIGLGGAVLMGITAYTGLLGTSFFGGGTGGEALQIDLLSQ